MIKTLKIEQFNNLTQEDIKKAKAKGIEYKVVGNPLDLDCSKCPMLEQEGVKFNIYNGITRYPENIELLPQIQDRLNSIVNSIPKDISEEEKIKLLNEKIANSVRYVEDKDVLALYSKNFNELSSEDKQKIVESQNLTGLVTGRAVCGGFSKILEAACTKMGINCEQKIGYAEPENGKKEYHAWNEIRLKDGRTVYADPTWDSALIQKGMQPKYCLMEKNQFDKDHQISFKETWDKYKIISKDDFGYKESNGLIYWLLNTTITIAREIGRIFVDTKEYKKLLEEMQESKEKQQIAEVPTSNNPFIEGLKKDEKGNKIAEKIVFPNDPRWKDLPKQLEISEKQQDGIDYQMYQD